MKYLDEILALPAEERLALAQAILESVETDEPPISAELAAELDRRIAYADAHPETLRPWEEVEAEIFGKE